MGLDTTVSVFEFELTLDQTVANNKATLIAGVGWEYMNAGVANQLLIDFSKPKFNKDGSTQTATVKIDGGSEAQGACEAGYIQQVPAVQGQATLNTLVQSSIDAGKRMAAQVYDCHECALYCSTLVKADNVQPPDVPGEADCLVCCNKVKRFFPWSGSMSHGGEGGGV